MISEQKEKKREREEEIIFSAYSIYQLLEVIYLYLENIRNR
jgi:hypothetical protein